MLSGRNFLVTGSTGRLGCALVERLEQLGGTVQPIVLEGYPLGPKRVGWGARCQPIQVSNIADLNGLEDPSCVINLHWRVERSRPPASQISYELEHNVGRLAYLWDWLAGKSVERFINISSIRVFSSLNGDLVNAATEPRPDSPYGIAKFAAEKFFDAHFGRAEIPVAHLRLCSVASIGEHPSQLMTQLYLGAFEKREVTLYARKMVHLLYIDEMVDLIIGAALSANRERYNLAPEGSRIETVVRRFEKIAGRKLTAVCSLGAGGESGITFADEMGDLRGEWSRTSSMDDLIKRIIDLNRSARSLGHGAS